MSERTRFLHPRYWPVWVGYGLLWVVVRLPHRARIGFGAGLGRLAWSVAAGRRRVVQKNLELCFPELDAGGREKLGRGVFRSGGISIIETAIAWLGRSGTVMEIAELEGQEHMTRALAKGKGVILLGSHLSTLDLAGAILSRDVTIDVMYRKNDNPLIEHIMTTGRERLYPSAIERNDIRQVIRNLKAGHVVWYGPDQDYGPRNAEFVPFFGVPAATTTAASRIAKITGAPVIPFSHYREDGAQSYRVILHPEWEDFPSDSAKADCLRINQFVEAGIRLHPEQYWWFHRRFKSAPEGQSAPY